METIAERIKKARLEIGMTQPELAKAAGVSKGTISLWENGINEPNGKNLHSLSDALNKTPDYILYGIRGNIDNATSVNVTRKIPLISWIAAGAWCESPDTFAPGDAEEWLPLPHNAGVRSFALRVDGDSMTPKHPGGRSYPHGTIIYVDPDKMVTNGCRVVARAPNGTYTFKTYFEDAGRMYLKAINTDYAPIDITDNVHICGVVIGSYLPE